MEKIPRSERILWEGRRTVKSFYDMIFCGSLLIVASSLTPLFLALAGIQYFSLFGLLVGAFLFLLAIFLSLSYRYVVTERALRKEYSFFARSREEVPLDRITNVVVSQDIVGRALGFGNVRADTAGTAYMGISFIGVEDPYGCAETIRRVVENVKKRHSDQSNEDRKCDPIDIMEIQRVDSEAAEKKISKVKDELASMIKNLPFRSRVSSSTNGNDRILYIPMQPLYDYVLDRLRRSPDKPIKETVKAVFRFAAEHLGWKQPIGALGN